MSFKKLNIVVTGSSGFIGSKLVANLVSCGHNICAIDSRLPSNHLIHHCLKYAPSENAEILKGNWKNLNLEKDSITTFLHHDLTDITNVSYKLEQFIDKSGCIDYVFHFAAFWNYKKDFVQSYQIHNIDCTDNLYNLVSKLGAKKFIFASSVEALPYVNKWSDMVGPINQYHDLDKIIRHPYGWSKAVSEECLIRKSNINTNVVILRLGGVFSDWSELPPLSWLIERWVLSNYRRIIPGKGLTAMPFIHRDNLMLILQSIMENENILFDP